MDRSRSKRIYYYDDQDYDQQHFSRTRPRYHNNNKEPFSRSRNSSYGGGGGGGGRMGGKTVDTSVMVTTSFRILCDGLKAGLVIGKSGSIIKAIRQHTGAKVNVHEVVDDDEERIIEISDTRRRDPDGRMPAFSPAQEALFLIHERLIESETFGDDNDSHDGGRDGGGRNDHGRVMTRLVVSKMHIGSLLGKGGRIIEQTRMETRTQIRILPRDHTSPRCVSLGEEIVQIVGDASSVKNAISVISSRIRESQHRDRGNNQGRHHSDERFEDDFVSQTNNSSRRDGAPYNSRLSGSFNNRSNPSRSGGYGYESEGAHRIENGQASFEDLVFRILCPSDKIDSGVGESSGILDLLRNEIGVDVKVSDPVDGSEERIIIVSSDEGPEDELFPAQEALLHIQTHIMNSVPDKDNIVTTRLLVNASHTKCFDRDGSLSEMKKSTGANIEILSREKLPAFISANDVLVQIVGEIKEARDALVEVTAKLRSHLYNEFLQRDKLPPSDSVQPPKDAGLSSSETSKQNGNDRREDTASSRREDTATSLNSTRMQIPMVTRSTLEVVIPEYAVTRLLAKSKNKLNQISELSGAKVRLIEDDPDTSEKFIRILGTPEQAEKAQSLFQGFFLSIQEDGP